MTVKEKKTLWNDAVRATLVEMVNYDGIIPEPNDRQAMVNNIMDKLAYKINSDPIKPIKVLGSDTFF